VVLNVHDLSGSLVRRNLRLVVGKEYHQISGSMVYQNANLIITDTCLFGCFVLVMILRVSSSQSGVLGFTTS
jgi:hypothetical protein